MLLAARPLLVVLLTLSFLTSGPVAPSSAEGPTYRAGQKCTIVGTPGPDHLKGTKRADVICGLGGDDVINGRGGDDRVIAGAGDDRVRGGSGEDLLDGGSGADVLRGDGGRDTLVGSAGADDLSGAGGPDSLRGDGGDDRLDGGPQPDVLDGGDGSNTCVVDSDDEAARCVYDLAAPGIAALEQSVGYVDVSASDQPVTVRVRATDDTGIKAVHIKLVSRGGISSYEAHDARLVAGTVRDGWWRTTIVVPQYAPSGQYGYQVGMYDQMNRWTTTENVQGVVLDVTSIDDTEQPVVESLIAPGPGTVLDVRSAGAQLLVTARFTDNLSGIGSAWVCPSPVHEYVGGGSCPAFALVSGTVRDGIWSATVPFPVGTVTDQWKLSIMLQDRANPNVPAQYYPDVEPWGPHLSPAGSGVFDLIGAAPPPPTREPQVSSVTLAPTTVDTLRSAASVSATVALDDPDSATVKVEVGLQQTRPGGYTDVSFHGTLQRDPDGLWRGRVVLPQGAPPGRYQAFVFPYRERFGARASYVDAFVTVVDSTVG